MQTVLIILAVFIVIKVFSIVFKIQLNRLRYHMLRWTFRWVSDSSGDIGLELFRVVTFLKHRHNTFVYWFAHYPDANYWQGKDDTDWNDSNDITNLTKAA